MVSPRPWTHAVLFACTDNMEEIMFPQFFQTGDHNAMSMKLQLLLRPLLIITDMQKTRMLKNISHILDDILTHAIVRIG